MTKPLPPSPSIQTNKQQLKVGRKRNSQEEMRGRNADDIQHVRQK